jgi:putative heme-binding domain-containing protein
LPRDKWGLLLEDLKTAEVNDLKSSLKSGDPFRRHAGITALTTRKDEIKVLATDQDPEIRLAALLAARNSSAEELDVLAKEFLEDQDPTVRKMAMIWVGDAQMVSLKGDIKKSISVGVPSTELFETYLETVKLLQPEFVDGYKERLQQKSNSFKRELPERFVAGIVQDKANPIEIRVNALRFLENPEDHKTLLLSFLSNEIPDQLRLETIRTLQAVPAKEIADKFLEISLDVNNAEAVRAEALAGLAKQPFERGELLIPLLGAEEENIKIETARLLRAKISNPQVRKEFQNFVNNPNSSEGFQQQIQLGLGQELQKRPNISDDKAWASLLDGAGDPERGRRVFFSTTSLCSTCHKMEGRGGDLGPDLSNVGKSKDRNQLIISLLDPSAEMSPEWQGWYIKLKDGTVEQGRQIDVGNDQIKLYTQSRGFIEVDKKDIEDYGMVQESLMPNGLEQRLTDQDLRDLLTFLERLN